MKKKSHIFNAVTSEELRDLYSNRDSSLDYIYDMAVSAPDTGSMDSKEQSTSLENDVPITPDRYKNPVWINGGAMKNIFKVYDKVTKRHVAMACLKKDSSEKYRELFFREAYITAFLEHPNVMPVYDIGVAENNLPFFTMKLTGDHNLGDLIREKGENLEEWTLLQRLNIFLEICAGTAFAHSKHILHLDLKPANIQIGDFGEVLICDWGLAKLLFDEFNDEERQNMETILFNDFIPAGTVRGTPGFMSPEQIKKGSGACDRKSDIYALGAILYSILSGKYPAEGRTMSIIDKTISGNIPATETTNKNRNIPYALQAVINKALSPDPENRYETVEDLSNDINTYLNGFATAAEDAGIWRNFMLLIKRHRVIFTTILLIFVICIGFIIRLRISEQTARKLLQMYMTEKKSGMKLKRETVPGLIELAYKAIDVYKFKKAEALIDKAFKLSMSDPRVWEAAGRLHFYKQEFNAAAAALKKSSEGENHEFYKLSVEFGKLKTDNEMLKHDDFIRLLRQFKYFVPPLRIMMAYKRKHYTDLKEYLDDVHFVFELINPEVKKVHFEFYTKNGKNYLDLSGNGQLARPKLELITGLPIHNLNLEGLRISYFDLKYLQNMPVEELNLNVPTIVECYLISKIKSLKVVILKKGVYSDSALKLIPKNVKIIFR